MTSECPEKLGDARAGKRGYYSDILFYPSSYWISHVLKKKYFCC